MRGGSLLPNGHGVRKADASPLGDSIREAAPAIGWKRRTLARLPMGPKLVFLIINYTRVSSVGVDYILSNYLLGGDTKRIHYCTTPYTVSPRNLSDLAT